jgi:hypothetical protein
MFELSLHKTIGAAPCLFGRANPWTRLDPTMRIYRNIEPPANGDPNLTIFFSVWYVFFFFGFFFWLILVLFAEYLKPQETVLQPLLKIALLNPFMNTRAKSTRQGKRLPAIAEPLVGMSLLSCYYSTLPT